MLSDKKTPWRNSDRLVMRPEDFTVADIKRLENTRAPAEASAFDYEVTDHETGGEMDQPQVKNHIHADRLADIRKRIAEADADKHPTLSEDDVDKHFESRRPPS